jgi:hypothetical protein
MTMYCMPGCCTSTVRPNLTQHKVSLSRCNRTHWSGMHCLRDGASSKGRIVQGTHRPRDTKSRGCKIPNRSSRDTLFRDTTFCHCVYMELGYCMVKQYFLQFISERSMYAYTESAQNENLQMLYVNAEEKSAHTISTLYKWSTRNCHNMYYKSDSALIK